MQNLKLKIYYKIINIFFLKNFKFFFKKMSISEKFSGAIGRTVNDKEEIKDDLKLKQFVKNTDKSQNVDLNKTKKEYMMKQPTQTEYNPRNRTMLKEHINHENMKISAQPIYHHRIPETYIEDKICLDLFVYFGGTLNKLIKEKKLTSIIDLELEKDFFMKKYAKNNERLTSNVLNKLREHIQIVVESTKIHSYSSTCPAHVEFTSDYFTPTRIFDNYRCAYPIMANQKMNKDDCYEINGYQSKTWNMIEKLSHTFRNFNEEIMSQMGKEKIENPDEQGGRFYKTLHKTHPIVEIHSTDGVISKEHQQYLKQHKDGKFIVSDEALDVLKQTSRQKFDKLPIIEKNLKYSIKPFGDTDEEIKDTIIEYLYANKDVVKDSERNNDGVDTDELNECLSKHFEIIIKMTVKFKFQVPDPNLINIQNQ
jgi:hypothetical protein